jgi:hypothetical protein
MKSYLVTWKIHIEAKSPKEAAQKALKIQRNPESIATYFEVYCEKHLRGKTIIGKTVGVDLLD